MNYIYKEFHAQAGNIVEVTLNQQANVHLFDPVNYRRFKNGQQCHGFGGRALQSPTRLNIPSNGTWYLVLDLGGASGTLRHSIRLID